ncbi:glycine zipper 2TM domain-containing protein [Tahibacter amnicola]|uniref:Glycine zipper 2TM domain-containing protein n=1 Tax=Tahibacter amnicola TaxID=2976241 RepID=A0ABY6BJK9_9GAMM|nr:glycine zipper 2TM domain-containing protein [Tahibacter amnicola]UXI69947.1 glycine zipper 2TM domain-containing protein [Tahibacter amnicola]
MSRTLLLILAAGLVMSQTVSAQEDRGRSDEAVHYAWADVVRVDPIYTYERVSRPERECYDERVTHREDGRGNNTGATVLGAIIGGALGNQVGKGDGRKAATIAGAVAGGAIGNSAARRDDRTYTSTERHCREVDGGYEERRVNGYDVEYRYRGETYMSRLDYDPGERIRVRVSVTPAE